MTVWAHGKGTCPRFLSVTGAMSQACWEKTPTKRIRGAISRARRYGNCEIQRVDLGESQIQTIDTGDFHRMEISWISCGKHTWPARDAMQCNSSNLIWPTPIWNPTPYCNGEPRSVISKWPNSEFETCWFHQISIVMAWKILQHQFHLSEPLHAPSVPWKNQEIVGSTVRRKETIQGSSVANFFSAPGSIDLHHLDHLLLGSTGIIIIIIQGYEKTKQ